MTRSAEAPLWVGIVLKTRMRSLPPSAMNSRVPVESAKPRKIQGRIAGGGIGRVAVRVRAVGLVQRTGVSSRLVSSVEKALLGSELVTFGWPDREIGRRRISRRNRVPTRTRL